MTEFRRFQPTVSHARSYVSLDSSDDEIVPTLPMIINNQPIRHRRLPSQYLPSTSFATVIEDEPFVYQRFHTPTFIEERPLALYRSYERPVRRVVQVSPPPPPPKRNVHLPKHTKKLVNRFLNNLEQAHDHHHTDENESDSSSDDCYVCRRLRSAMNDGKHRSANESRPVHSRNCEVCNLLEKADFSISDRPKQEKYVHIINTIPSNNQVTTVQPQLYPLGYTTFIDPNWQNNTQSYPSTMDKATYTRITSGDQEQQSNEKTIIVHTTRNPTPRTPKIIIEQPRRHHRRSRRNRSEIVVTERIPRTKTRTYI